MNEPVAYRVDGTIYNDIKDAEYAVREIEHLRNELGMDNGLIRKPIYIEPLYTSEYLPPRVKMTKAEFDEWKEIFGDFELFSDAMVCGVTRKNHIKLFEYIYSSKNNGLSGQESESRFAKLWTDFDPEHSEETIEIVPDMKWFVRSKEKYEADPVQGISESGYLYLTDGGDDYSISYCEMTTFKDEANQFDTKAEAEKWTNPDTEAVQLPVEDK